MIDYSIRLSLDEIVKNSKDEKVILENINNIALTSEKDETRLKALFKLSDIMDLEDKSRTTVTQVSGALFQGFADKHLVEAERPKELSD